MIPKGWRVILGLLGFAALGWTIYYYWYAPFQGEPQPLEVVLDE